MDWKDIAGAVGKAAPLLGTLLGGPAGAAVGGLIASALGTASDPAEVQAAMASPDALVKLREIEATNRVRLQELAFANAEALAKTAAADRADARQMQVQLRSWIPGFLAIVITLGFFGILATMLSGIWEPKDNSALLILLGSLGTAWGAIVNYYFGSSAGSARKDELLANSQPATPGRP
jgi:hypothetical protein